MKFKIGDRVIVKKGTRYEYQRYDFGVQIIIERGFNGWDWHTNHALYNENDLEFVGTKEVKQFGIVKFLNSISKGE